MPRTKLEEIPLDPLGRDEEKGEHKPDATKHSHAEDWKTIASARTHFIRTFIEESTLLGGILDLGLSTSKLVDQAFDLAPKLLQSKYAWLAGTPWGLFMAYYDALGHRIRDHLNQAEVKEEMQALLALSKDDGTPRFDKDYIKNLEVPRAYRLAVKVHVIDEVLSWPSWSNLLYLSVDGRLGAQDTLLSFIATHIFGNDSDITRFFTNSFDVVKPLEHSTFILAGLTAGLINYFTEERTYSSFAQQYLFWETHRHLLLPKPAAKPQSEPELAGRNYKTFPEEESVRVAADTSWCGMFDNCLRRRPNAAQSAANHRMGSP